MLTVGYTTNELPDPTESAPQPVSYQIQSALVPKDPFKGVNTVESPIQTVSALAIIWDAGKDSELVWINLDTQVVVLHVPSALAK